MAVSYKCLLHLMIEKDRAERICQAMNCTPNDVLNFLYTSEKERNDHV